MLSVRSLHSAVSSDNLRDHAVTLEGNLALRIDLLGVRIFGDAFLDQVAAALGC